MRQHSHPAISPTDTQFIGAGHRVGVLLGLDRYQELVDAAEALDELRAFDEATASGDEAISFEQAVREIEASHGAA